MALPAETGAEGTTGRQNDLLEGLGGLSVLRQVGVMFGLAASVAIGVWIVLWSQGEDYLPLYANLDKMDPTDVLNILQTNQIEHKVDPKTGALLVEADQIHQARLKLAGAGVSPDGSFGFELMEKEQPLGTSQFMENARFKRSLEGELARTISSIRAVKGARVHLAIPKPSAFIRDPRKPSASVFLELYNGGTITSEQVRAIANLVAFSIPELTLENVNVVDQRGNLLSNFDSDEEMAVAHKQMEYVHALETRISNRIGSILEPILGPDRFRAEVAADVDFTQVEQTDELFNPDLPSVRSEQLVEESRGGQGGLGGIPGALSNQPPADAEAPEQAAAGAAGAGAETAKGSSRRQSVRNYELDRTISHTRHQVGRISRLSVAVLVDNVAKTNAAGETVSAPMPQEELDRLSILVRDAVGYDASRGDSVNIVNSPFLPKEVVEEVPIEDPPWWEQPAIKGYIRMGMMGLGILLLMYFLSRVMRSLADNAKEMREMEAQRALGALSGDLGGDLSDATVTLSGGDSLLLGGPNESYEQQLNAVKGLIAEDPGRVAQVVKKWVSSHD